MTRKRYVLFLFIVYCELELFTRFTTYALEPNHECDTIPLVTLRVSMSIIPNEFVSCYIEDKSIVI